jgi:8-oxo-dGTP pyrophosphatase MutT (NUDIX family)
MNTVFVNNKPLIFANVTEAQRWKDNPYYVFASESKTSIEDIILDMENTEDIGGIIYLSESSDASWQIFISYCKLSEAAGGLVMNERNEFLIILRHNKWDLPKGKLEYDEIPEAAAVREVIEECGIEAPEILRPLPKTFHTYHENGKRILKKTHWYLMQLQGAGILIPQQEEDIQEAHWMTKEEIREKVFLNTYASIKELLMHSLE